MRADARRSPMGCTGLLGGVEGDPAIAVLPCAEAVCCSQSAPSRACGNVALALVVRWLRAARHQFAALTPFRLRGAESYCFVIIGWDGVWLPGVGLMLLAFGAGAGPPVVAPPPFLEVDL